MIQTLIRIKSCDIEWKKESKLEIYEQTDSVLLYLYSWLFSLNLTWFKRCLKSGILTLCYILPGNQYSALLWNMCTKKSVTYIFLPLRLPSKQTYYILPVDRYITKIAGTLYPGGHLIIKNRYFNSSVTTRLRHLLLCLTHSSMTSLLIHTVAHSTRPSCRPKINNKPLKKFLSLEVSWVKVVKNWMTF